MFYPYPSFLLCFIFRLPGIHSAQECFGPKAVNRFANFKEMSLSEDTLDSMNYWATLGTL